MPAGRLRASARQLFPPIAWREEKLAERTAEVRRLRAELRRSVTAQQYAEAEAERLRLEFAALRNRITETRAALQRPSWQRSLDDLRRNVVTLRSVDREKAHPLRQLPFKLRNYRLALSHGVPAPEVYATWGTVDEIDLRGLPDEFVLKSDGGAGGHGVFPLRRLPDGRFAVVSTEETVDEDGIRSRIRRSPRLSGPFFAEELLRSPEGSAIPEDVKVYAYYGEIGQVLLRRVHEHGNLSRTYYRFVDAHGEDLGDGVEDENLDPSIAPPTQLAAMIDVSKHLSRAVGVPFVRVDLYQTPRGVVLGELTRGPGGSPRYSPAHDELMGRLYEEARWRLERDLQTGRPPGILHGVHDAPNLYPPEHVSQREDPGTWGVTRVQCPDCRP